ncbi:uncharacterized protein LOC143288160 [Babylonia areolata]|uniref:uncharacterized protein LOC143288160 n=1 Tax=Babylonia areolata TaxID=304850 RepID=UPI003FD6401B
MLIFGLFQGQRLTLDVGVGKRVREVREMIQSHLNIIEDNDKHDKKVLVLSWAGSDLQDPWVFSDLGLVPGSTIHVQLKEEVKPVLHIRCSHSQDTLSVYDSMVIGHMHMHELRSLASRKTGLPVGIFRLVLKDGTEMYDGHRLEKYGLDVGDTVLLETLDGWSELLNLAVMGFTPQVMSQISSEEVMGRYQLKVALFLAAHHGHVDLARAVLRQGVRASEAVGYPPQRMWCSGQDNDQAHLESHKAPIHQAVEMGQLGVLRVFVNNDITVVMAKDGEGLAPLNIALRKKIKNCASFLLTKQWSKVNVTKTFALNISFYNNLRQWCEKAKERVYVKYGQSKSSLKRRPFQTGPLVGFGVHVDGYSRSIMTGKSKAQVQREKEREEKRRLMATQQSRAQTKITDTGVSSGNDPDPEAYFKHVVAVQNLKSMAGEKVKGGKAGRIARTASKTKLAPPSDAATSRTQRSPEPTPLPTGSRAGVSGGKTSTQPPELQPAEDMASDTPRLPSIHVTPARTARTARTARAGAQSTMTQSQQSVITVTSSGAAESRKDSSQQQQQQQQQRSSGSGVMVPRLMTSRGRAYFMTGGTKQPPSNPTSGKVPTLQLPGTDRSERGAKAAEPEDSQADTAGTSGLYFADFTDTPTTPVEEEGEEAALTQLPPIPTTRSVKPTARTNADDVTAAPLTSTRSLPVSQRKPKKKKRVTSALLLSKATANEGSIPLPLLSDETDRRPFFYYNGQREEAFVLPTISTWSEHVKEEAGATPRERAIKSMSVANTFKEKPWLSQVRIALKITTNPTKRNVRRLRGAKKGTFAV